MATSKFVYPQRQDGKNVRKQKEKIKKKEKRKFRKNYKRKAIPAVPMWQRN